MDSRVESNVKTYTWLWIYKGMYMREGEREGEREGAGKRASERERECERELVLFYTTGLYSIILLLLLDLDLADPCR